MSLIGKFRTDPPNAWDHHAYCFLGWVKIGKIGCWVLKTSIDPLHNWGPYGQLELLVEAAGATSWAIITSVPLPGHCGVVRSFHSGSSKQQQQQQQNPVFPCFPPNNIGRPGPGRVCSSPPLPEGHQWQLVTQNSTSCQHRSPIQIEQEPQHHQKNEADANDFARAQKIKLSLELKPTETGQNLYLNKVIDEIWDFHRIRSLLM